MNKQTQAEDPNRLQELEAENVELRRRLEERAAADRQREADEVVIAEKMERGLSREQAIHVIARQREFDAGRKNKIGTAPAGAGSTK